MTGTATTITRTYSLLGSCVTIHGIETATTLAERLDALLGPCVAAPSRASHSNGVTLTLQHEDAVWRVFGSDERSETPLHSEEHVAQVIESLAYGEAIRHAALPLILHSGAVVRDGIAVLLPNVSGAGKTTLTLALAARGWLPLTDDICPLRERDGELVAVGCQRCCHLSAASLAALDAHGAMLEGPVANLDTYYRPRQWGTPAPVRAIVIPRYLADSPTRFDPVTQAECLGQLTSMMFAQSVYPGYARRVAASRLAAEVPGFTLTYSTLDEALDVFERLRQRLSADRSSDDDAHHAGV